MQSKGGFKAGRSWDEGIVTSSPKGDSSHRFLAQPTSVAEGDADAYVLQFCHGYDGPFLDCARQYAALFEGTEYKVLTVFLTGSPSTEVELAAASDEVIFLGYKSKQIRGLKLGAMRDIRRIVAERNVRFCIAHRFKPIFIATLATSLPVIGVHHAFGGYRRSMRRLFANAFRNRLQLLAVSDAVRDDIRACLPTWPLERIDTLHNRIDVPTVRSELLPREEARERLGLPRDAWVVGNAGRLHPDKDQMTLIRGFARALPLMPASSMLVLMGEGRLERTLNTLADELGVGERVRFLGQVKQARRYFKAFDVFALTSDHEPFGMVLLEAMAAGVPVVCSDSGGAREVVMGVGKFFPQGDVEALAQRLVEPPFPDSAAASLARLETSFSDNVIRQRFWRMPFWNTMRTGGKLSQA